jgi:hypothetical protein
MRETIALDMRTSDYRHHRPPKFSGDCRRLGPCELKTSVRFKVALKLDLEVLFQLFKSSSLDSTGRSERPSAIDAPPTGR